MRDINDLSVIIPMYNNADTIVSLLKAISDFIKCYDGKVEVICVDDGSSDSTVKVVENYAEDNNEVNLIRQKNKGVSLARNAGLKKANGNFIVFLDADDVISPEEMNIVMEKTKSDTDLLFSEVVPLKHDKYIHITDNNCRLQLYKDLADIGNYRIPINVTFTVYSHKFLIDNKIIFDSHLRVGEDMLFNLQCLAHARNIILTSEKYYYLQESHSVYLFKEENLKNELYFRKKTDTFFKINERPEADVINQRMAIKGIIFLVYRYFVPGVYEKKITFDTAVKKLRSISESKEYAKYIVSNKLDSHLSGREKLVRRLLGKHHYRLTIFAGIVMNKLKPEKRH